MGPLDLVKLLILSCIFLAVESEFTGCCSRDCDDVNIFLHAKNKWANRTFKQNEMERAWMPCDECPEMNQQERDRLMPDNWKLHNKDDCSMIFDSTKPKISENTTFIVDEILRLLALGEEAIELSEQTDIIMVVGMTGSGKSAVTQFLAGLPNQLESERGGEGYIIKDHCGSVSNETIISKTLLPELTIDEETKTAFYDCPGFSDTRNESVEIANAFFIKKVADHGKRIKLVLVVPKDVFGSRTEFTSLLRQLAVFIRDVDKMVDGISMIITKVSTYPFCEAEYFNYTIRNFLKIIEKELPCLSWNDPKHLENAINIVKAISLLDENEDFKKIGIFRSPLKVGFLDEMELFQCNKENLKRLIWERTQYMEKVDDDFGYGLSPEAKLLIRDVVESIDNSITTNLTTLSSELKDNFIAELNNLENNQNIPSDLVTDIQVLKSTSYPLCQNEENLPPPVYTAEILENIISFIDDSGKEEIISTLQHNTNFLVFFKNATEDGISINPKNWVSPLIEMKLDVLNHFHNIAGIIDNSITSNLTNWCMELETNFILELNYLENLQPIPQELIIDMGALNKSFYPICENQEGFPPHIYTTEIIDNIDKFTDLGKEEIISILERGKNFLVFLRNGNENIKFYPKNWVAPLLEMKSAVFYQLDKIAEIFFKRSFDEMDNICTIAGYKIVENFDKILSVHKRKLIVENFVIITENLTNNIQTEFDDNPEQKLSEFIEFVLKNLQESIPDIITGGIIASIQEILPYLYFAESFGRNNWRTVGNWIEPFKNLNTVIEDERYWLHNFIIELFNNLSEDNVQIVEPLDLKTWWLTAQPFSLEKFDNFSSTFSHIKAVELADMVKIKELLKDQRKIASLNTVMNSTLFDDFSCERNDDQLVCKGKYISLDKTYEKAKKNKGIENLAILGYHTIFFDGEIVGSVINREKNLNVFVMAPNLKEKYITTFDLSGPQGDDLPSNAPDEEITGNLGKKAGNACVIGQFMSPITIKLMGGKGGTGGKGKPGIEGKKGARKYISDRDNDDCAAWVDGEIQVRKYPNSCNPPGGKCHAGNNGAYVTLDGFNGENGGIGGKGGKGGTGGFSGSSLTISITNINATSIVEQGGQSGDGGIGGNGGIGGLKGDTHHMYIDDMWGQIGEYLKHCKVVDDIGFYPVDERAPSGNQGAIGNIGNPGENGTAIENTEAYKTHINTFKSEAIFLLDNEFFNSPLSEFIQLVNDHPSIV